MKQLSAVGELASPAAIGEQSIVAQGYADGYLEAARFGEDRRGSLFRSCEPGRRDVLQEWGMSRVGAFKMIKRRAREAGLPAEICAHSFRGTGITEYLRNGGDLEVAARIAGHESTCTTQLYNRLREEISLDEIERIHGSAKFRGVRRQEHAPCGLRCGRGRARDTSFGTSP